MVRTTLTVGANVASLTGGIFLPLLAIGALLSGTCATLCETVFGLDASYYPAILVLGITACIAGMMKMPLTAIAFAVEALSGSTMILPILLVTAVSYGITELFGAVSINDRVLDSRIHRARVGRQSITRETTVTIQPGAFAIDKEIRDIFWPAGLFVLSVAHRRALGGHTLHEGDELYIRYVTYHEPRLWDELTAIVGKQPNEH